MQNNSLVPRIVLRSIAGGMWLMAFFTYGWVSVADVRGWTWAALAFALTLVATGIYFFLASRDFPRLRSDADREKGKRMGMWYGILFGAEGAIIGGTCAVLASTGHDAFIVPSIALIVGLHFIPMATLFQRSIDYYIASWACLVGMGGIYMVYRGEGPAAVNLLTGLGMGAATSAYGIFMTGKGYDIVQSRRAPALEK